MSKNTDALTSKVKLPGDNEPARNVLDVFKAQVENFSNSTEKAW